ncbi:MAG: histone deacetylase [Sphingobium sp.]|nr:histone deacetylase [Sphingobium sp.]MCP5399559.1 histone deacetylase [Sphingomonas sp.]
MLHVAHHPAYVSPAAPGSRFSFDKYGMVMLALKESDASFTLHEPEPMERHWVEAVHDPDYVEEVVSLSVPAHKERRIGFPIIERVMRRSFLSSGGTWLAANLALEHGYAANSAGGSHHALPDTGAGYCVFNDLAITANRLTTEGVARRVLVLDLDVHQGDGTAVLLAGREDIFTLSIHAERNFPARKARSSLDIGLPDNINDVEYIDTLMSVLPQVLDDFHPEIILYQAGVDPHAEDRLGRLALSDAGLEVRDRTVIREARTRGIAVASTLGGGYGDDKAEIARRHVASMLAMADENRAMGPRHG